MAIENTPYLQYTVCCPQGDWSSRDAMVAAIATAIADKMDQVRNGCVTGNEHSEIQIARIAYDTMAPHFAPPF